MGKYPLPLACHGQDLSFYWWGGRASRKESRECSTRWSRVNWFQSTMVYSKEYLWVLVREDRGIKVVSSEVREGSQRWFAEMALGLLTALYQCWRVLEYKCTWVIFVLRDLYIRISAVSTSILELEYFSLVLKAKILTVNVTYPSPVK